MPKIVDLRSDTVTLPTPAMREAMYRAEVGDDVFGEDPTVNRLEAMAAAKMGKEAALFVASGTMGNLVSILSHCQRGDEVLLGEQAHSFIYEVAGAAVVGGLSYHPLPEHRGILDPGEVVAAIRPDNIHVPRTGLVCLENTHNRHGGVASRPAQIQAVTDVAHRHGIPVHLDGARIFNAAIALGIDAREMTQHVDSVTFCLSKGLSCPVGSLVCGPQDFIARARKNRKMLGGGMRQAGILAAAGIVALETMIDRLAEDHAHARLLAAGIAAIPGLAIDLSLVDTNIVIFDLVAPQITPAAFLSSLAQEGVKVSIFPGTRRLRAVTHYGIERADIDVALTAMQCAMTTM
jgi:threonine aldolase